MRRGLVVLCLLPLVSCGRADRDEMVIYVPGWQNIDRSQVAKVAILERIFPARRIQVEQWPGTGGFLECVDKADQAAVRLTDKIAGLAPEDRENVVLIGHSLGGRIVVRAMAALQARGLKIKRGIFLAAAIPDDDPDIARALRASRLKNINVYNKQDHVLRDGYGVVGGEGLKNALGAYGYGLAYPCALLHDVSWAKEMAADDTLDEYVDKYRNHAALKYLAFLEGLAQTPVWALPAADDGEMECANATKTLDDIPVLQDRPYPPMKTIDLGWKTVDVMGNWRLQWKNVPLRGEVYRIVDPKDRQRADGSSERMYEAFSLLKQRLKRSKP